MKPRRSEAWNHTLLMFAQFSFQCANVLDAVFEYHALCRQLLVHFLAQVVWAMSAKSNAYSM
jgi:hypothetical protein